MTEIQQLLRELRKFHNKTLADVASFSGLSVSYLSDLERGRQTPFDSALATVNKIFGCYGLRARLQLEPIDSQIDPHGNAGGKEKAPDDLSSKAS